MDTSLILSLITAFGLGSIITVVVQSLLSRRTEERQRSFEERKAAYIGLLEAYHRAGVEGTEAAGKEFAYWQMRCELVSPKVVRDAIRRIVETNDDPKSRYVAHQELEKALRNDLGVSA